MNFVVISNIGIKRFDCIFIKCSECALFCSLLQTWFTLVSLSLKFQAALDVSIESVVIFYVQAFSSLRSSPLLMDWPFNVSFPWKK